MGCLCAYGHLCPEQSAELVPDCEGARQYTSEYLNKRPRTPQHRSTYAQRAESNGGWNTRKRDRLPFQEASEVAPGASAWGGDPEACRGDASARLAI